MAPSGIGIGVGVTYAGSPAGGGGASNPNLLLAPEAFDNVVWVKPAVTVTADYGDGTHPTADRLAMPNTRQCLQNALTAGVAGSNIANISITASWVRYSATATIDGLDYTYSVEIIAISGATSLRISVAASGGVIQVMLQNLSGSSATFGVYGAKLEQASSFSGYP